MKLFKIIFVLMASLCLILPVSGQNTFPFTGNVGIGTFNPQQLLHVHSKTLSVIEISGAEAGVLFSPTATTGVSTAAIGLTTASQSPYYLIGSNVGDLNFRSSVGGRLLFGTLANGATTGTIRMEIGNNGKVNIGSGASPDPYALLNVEGAISATGAIRNLAIKLDGTKGRLKMRHYQSGDLAYKTGMAPSTAAIGELYLNFNGDFANGTRVMGSQLTVDGNVGIGTSDTRGYELAVKGKILSEELKIRTYATWPDYVFEEGYNLRSLSEVEKAIDETGHLPGIPSAEEVGEDGFNVSEMNAKLLEKVEELTLYMIELDKKVERLEEENRELKGSLLND